MHYCHCGRPAYRFDIGPVAHGLWRVEDRAGRVGGVFRTRHDALRFALLEVEGDTRRIRFRGSVPRV